MQTVVTIGTFDGVHRGHQAVLERVQEYAQQLQLEPVAYTFSFPPRFSSPGPHLILTERMKMALLRQYVTRVALEEFTRVRDLSPDEFFHRVIVEQLHAQVVVVGENFRFGRNRRGDAAFLREAARTVGITAVIVPPVVIAGAPVSSTRIRTLIQAGNVAEATTLLGRPPVATGIVVPGDRLGRTIGYPTANLSLPAVIVRPGAGVYLGYAVWETGQGYGLVYVGTRPTVDGEHWRVEVHLLSPPHGELGGKEMEIHLLARLRADQAFPSLAALTDQITADVSAARALIPQHPCPRSILFPSRI